MKVIFTELAQAELVDAADFYELKVPYIQKIDKRRCVQNYHVSRGWSVEQDHILVIPIAHQHRKPDYWIDKMCRA